MPVLLDLNNPVFQRNWFALERDEKLAVLASLEKITKLEWQDVYRDKGLRWEAIQSRTGPHGGRLYSFRITQKMRGIAYRDGEHLRILDLHPDHDSAYR
jgi:hypothetical protein